MNIHRLNSDGTHPIVMMGVEEKDLEVVFNALPKGRYFYFDVDGTKWFNETGREVTVTDWLD